MSEDVSAEAKELAADLDRAPSGEEIIQRLLNAQVALQHKNADLEAKLDRLCDQMLLLTNLLDGHQAAIQLLQAGGGRIVH